MNIQQNSSWQAVLQKIIQPTRERQRLASALGVNTITLTRWARQDSHPQRSYLAMLVKVVQPHQRAELLNALLAAYPDMQDKLLEETAEAIPSTFFRYVLQERASINEILRRHHISMAILSEALHLLDPNQLGMAVTPALCMPAVQSRVLSLREQGGRGTVPWTADLEHKSIFLGLNSLAGHVVQSGRPDSIVDVKTEQYIPVFAYPEHLEISASAAPIWLEGKIAGCLLAASTQRGHFTQSRIDLLTNFANLYTLALSPSDFHEHRLVQLRYIPEPPHQDVYLNSFRQRVTRLMAEAGRQGKSLSSADAELRAWQEIEEQLIKIGPELDDTEI
jgi:hypothetical protein